MNPTLDLIMFFLVVLMAIFVGITGIARFAGYDLLCESMIRSDGGRIVVNILYILIGISGLVMAGTYIKNRM